jgi:hypothetical protein
MKALLLLMVLCLPAMGQRKLWTWNSPLEAEPNYMGAIHALATDAKGFSVLVIGEGVFPDWSQPATVHYRLLWVGPTGVILHEERIEKAGERYRQVGMMYGVSEWSVLLSSSSACAVTDGKQVWSITMKGRSKERRVTEVAEGETAFSLNSFGAFPGWMQRRSRDGAEVDSTGQVYRSSIPLEISLWSLK